MNPYCNFSASVNFATSGYNRSNINSYYNSDLYSENTKSSTINYTQRFPDSPWSLSLTASLTQRTKDSTISLTAPELTVNMSSIYPFKLARQATLKRKGKIATGKEKWYRRFACGGQEPAGLRGTIQYHVDRYLGAEHVNQMRQVGRLDGAYDRSLAWRMDPRAARVLFSRMLDGILSPCDGERTTQI